MNPIDVANHLRNRYVSYLTTTFGLSGQYDSLYARFTDLLETEGQLLKGPYLEGTAPFKPSLTTLQTLMASGRLHGGFADLFTVPVQAAPKAIIGLGGLGITPAVKKYEQRADPDRPLYVHQEKALGRLCRADWPERDLPHTVVASGTGSGKTECFLYPAIDWILRHPTATGGTGVRVLLVYPMNALVNDQIRRLRQLVGDRPGYPKIPVRFARYTSETEDRENAGRKKEPNAPANQLVSRERIIQTPPDLLITNFAMLEQAMLRPQETPFFTNVDAHAWRFVILDEAHSYRGAQGIELARLMQRLRATIRRGKQQAGITVLRDPICVATSATLSNDPDPRQVTSKFASDLFGVPFSPEAVIRAERLELTRGKPSAFASVANKEEAGHAWARLPENILTELDNPIDAAFKQYVDPLATPDGLEKAKKATDRRSYLFHLLSRHPQFQWLWEHVRERPMTLAELIAEADWAGESDDTRATALERLVSCCNAARPKSDDQPLLPCRYHLFASALEGMFLQLATDNEQPDSNWHVPDLGIITMAAHRIQPSDRKAVDLARCMGCGFPFVVLDQGPRSTALDQPPVWERPVDVFAFTRETLPDGTTLTPEIVDLALETNIPPTLPRTLYRVTATEDGTDVKCCPRCGREARYYDVVGRFQTGQDAPVSVLTESLYEQLPGLTAAQKTKLMEDAPGRFSDDSDPIVGGGRKLLLFSDSRQNAAFMASYLQEHSVEFLMRELGYRVLKPGEPPVSVAEWTARVLDVIRDLKLNLPFFSEIDLAADGADPFRKSYTIKAEQLKARTDRVLHHLLSETQGDASLSLEGLGLLTISSAFADSLLWDATPDNLELGNSGLAVSKADLKDLFDRVARLMRARYIVTVPGDVERPGYSMKQQSLVKQKSGGNEKNDNLDALVNKNSKSTAFVDLLVRWFARVSPGQKLTEAQIDHVSDFVFHVLEEQFSNEVFAQKEKDQTVLALKHEAIRVSRPSRLWKCGNCHAYATTFLGGACVERHCNGRLEPVAEEDFPANRPDRNLYVERFTSGKAMEMRCEEHTAQLSPELGQEFQEAFQVGQVNVLCCSTTFEMGIDLGDLQSIVLRNVPPGPANYIQRAGRAGRRADAVAFVLTFCQRRPHDRHFFANPSEIIAGMISPPRIDLDNRKILERHCFAEILTEYWQWLDSKAVDGKSGQFDKAGDVGLFFKCLLTKEGLTPAFHLAEWLAAPSHRTACVTRLREAFGLTPEAAGRFLDLLAARDDRQAFARATDDVTNLLAKYINEADACDTRVSILKTQRAAAATEKERDQKSKEIEEETGLANSYRKLDRQQRGEPLIGFLMGRGVLPSFAFPVNEVNLHVLAQELKPGAPDRMPRLRLKRDGRIGLADYAPGSEVVAGKHTYKSVGLRKFPALQFDFNQWVRWCPLCNDLRELQAEPDKDKPKIEPVCETCGGVPESGAVLPVRWVEPKWGYVTDVKADARKPHRRRPLRNQTTRAFFLGDRPDAKVDEASGFDEQEDTLPPGRSGAQPGIAARTARGRSLLVLNLGRFKNNKDGERARAGFPVCATCGRTTFEGKESLRSHRPPYKRGGALCSGTVGARANMFVDPVALGHKYETDVLWLDCHGAEAKLDDAGFWLSLAYALTNAAAMELNIERGDLEVTTVPLQGEGRQAVVIYDAVPGGAGHCRQILGNLTAVVRRARDVLSACSCAPASTNCYGCLCNYQNQFAHDQLSRGKALDYLNLLADEFSRGEPGPWRLAQPKPAREMADSVVRAAGPVTLVISAIRPGRIDGLHQDWFDVLKEAAMAPGGPARMKIVLQTLPGRDTPADVIANHRLAELKAMGVVVLIAHSAGDKQWIDIGGQEENAVVWQWQGKAGLSPDGEPARRSRVGRAANARAELPATPSGVPIADVKPSKRFHHFTLPGGTPRDPLHGACLGPVFARPLKRLMIVDPYVLSGRKTAEVLDRLLIHTKFAPGAVSLVKTQLLQETGRRNFASVPQQADEKTRLEAKHKSASLQIEILPRLREHDRIILVQAVDAEKDCFFRVLLGQGLDAFAGEYNRYSEVVWFEMEEADFHRDWKETISRK